MSSTRALKDITLKHGGEYFPSAVGEVNVVNKMKEVNAVIGGEGNGGIIVPDLHYGRDALIGIGLFLTHLAQSGKTYPATEGNVSGLFHQQEQNRTGQWSGCEGHFRKDQTEIQETTLSIQKMV